LRHVAFAAANNDELDHHPTNSTSSREPPSVLLPREKLFKNVLALNMNELNARSLPPMDTGCLSNIARPASRSDKDQSELMSDLETLRRSLGMGEANGLEEALKPDFVVPMPYGLGNRMGKESRIHACAVCGTKEKLLRCSRCKRVYYCGPEHQRSDFRLHRSECQAEPSSLCIAPLSVDKGARHNEPAASFPRHTG
jgi:hypothetical protein